MGFELEEGEKVNKWQTRGEMQAKDTIMSIEKTLSLIPDEMFDVIRKRMGEEADLFGAALFGAALYCNNEAQAEISFKAGMDFVERATGNQLLEIAEASKKVGRWEVVRWIKEHIERADSDAIDVQYTLVVSEREWQAKLKEWGMAEEQCSSSQQ